VLSDAYAFPIKLRLHRILLIFLLLLITPGYEFFLLPHPWIRVHLRYKSLFSSILSMYLKYLDATCIPPSLYVCVSSGHGIIDVQPMSSLLLFSHLFLDFGTKTNDWKIPSTLEHFCLWTEQVWTCSLYYPPLIRYDNHKWTSAFVPLKYHNFFWAAT
jgi:hypothetical protein